VVIAIDTFDLCSARKAPGMFENNEQKTQVEHKLPACAPHVFLCSPCNQFALCSCDLLLKRANPGAGMGGIMF
jgi:hypothetical protein